MLVCCFLTASSIMSGPPSAVSQLQTYRSPASITISWEAPWSLDVTGVDLDIWYSVLIQNVTDENNPTPISCTDCTNITETVYTFTPDTSGLGMCTAPSLSHHSLELVRERVVILKLQVSKCKIIIIYKLH